MDKKNMTSGAAGLLIMGNNLPRYLIYTLASCKYFRGRSVPVDPILSLKFYIVAAGTHIRATQQH